MTTFSAMTSISPVARRRVLVALGALGDRADDLQHVLVAQAVEDLFFTDHHLGHAGGVAQVNECDTTVVTTAGRPSRRGLRFVQCARSEGIRGHVCAAQHSFRRRIATS